MSAILDYMRLCRLCLVKDKVNVPIFGDTSDVRQIFLKISACLPVKVSQDDNLPKSICDTCLYKVDLLYQFWNTTVNAEKQLIQWLAEIGVDVNIKTPNPPQLRIVPQSHAHPHSMPEAIVLKEERQDPDMKAMEHSGQNFHMDHQNMYSGFEMPYPPQVNMTVGAPTDFTQPTDAPAEEEVKVPQQKPQPTQPTPAKRRGRPPKQKTPPSSAPVATTVTVSAAPTTSNSKRRSSAAAAAAAVAAAAANVSSDESDFDDRTGADDSDDEDMDIRIAKEEADSDDEEYVDNPESLEPTTFVGVPSTSACDSEQPGPSGLGGSTTTAKTSSALPANAANETGFGDKPKGLVIFLHEASSFTNLIPRIHMTKFYKCPSCPKTFEFKSRLERHSAVHIKTKDYPCPVCNLMLKSEATVTLHMKKHQLKPYKCEICLKEYAFKNSFESHIKYHPLDQVKSCQKCDRKFHNNFDLNVHMTRDHKNCFTCYSCNESFSDTESLKNHVIIHNGTESAKPQCEFCGRTFACRQSLNVHFRRQHLGLLSVVCDICGKKLSSKRSLEEHMLLHKGEKPLACERCGKTFAKKSTLRVHERTHTGAKPYACSHCDKRFTQRNSLVIHVRKHTGDRPFCCNLCSEKFISKSCLNLHLKSKHKLL